LYHFESSINWSLKRRWTLNCELEVRGELLDRAIAILRDCCAGSANAILESSTQGRTGNVYDLKNILKHTT